MVETRSRKTPTSEVKKAANPKTSDEEAVEATPSMTPGEVFETQAEELKKSGKNNSSKKNREEVESDEKNGGNDEADPETVEKLEAAEDNGEEMTAVNKNVKNVASVEKNDEKLKGEDIHGLKLKFEENNGGDLTADKINGEDLKTEQQDRKANSEEVNEEQIRLDIVEEEHKHLDNAEGNEKQLGIVEIVAPKHLVETGFEEKVEGEKEANTQTETPSKRTERKWSPREEAEQEYVENEVQGLHKEESGEKNMLGFAPVNAEEEEDEVEAEQEYLEVVENVVQGLQKEESGEKNVSGLEPVDAETVEGVAEQKFTVEMNTANRKTRRRKLKKDRKAFQRCEEKNVGRDADKMKIDQGISDIYEVEMGLEGAKEILHIVESERENGLKRGKKRKNRKRKREEGANRSSGEGRMLNRQRGAESKGMKGQTNSNKKKITNTNKEIDTDNRTPMSKKFKKARKFYRRSKLLRQAEKMMIEQGIPGIYKVEMGQEGAKEYLHMVESKRENEKKRGKKRKNKNREKGGGQNKSSGEGQKVNGEKGAEFEGMEGETNSTNKQTTYTVKEINNYVEMNTDNGKLMSKKFKRFHEFLQRCKGKKLLVDAEKMKIDEGVSEKEKVEMGQDGAKENSHIVERKRENEKKRGKKRKNQNREKGGQNKSSGEWQKVNGEKGAESKGMEGETSAKKKQKKIYQQGN